MGIFLAIVAIPIHLQINGKSDYGIDDEFDEASVQRNPEAPTPDSIAQIWGNRGHKVAYVGYTATIQANILQDTTERLWPKNFIELISFVKFICSSKSSNISLIIYSIDLTTG